MAESCPDTYPDQDKEIIYINDECDYTNDGHAVQWVLCRGYSAEVGWTGAV